MSVAASGCVPLFGALLEGRSTREVVAELVLWGVNGVGGYAPAEGLSRLLLTLMSASVGVETCSEVDVMAGALKVG